VLGSKKTISRFDGDDCMTASLTKRCKLLSSCKVSKQDLGSARHFWASCHPDQILPATVARACVSWPDTGIGSLSAIAIMSSSVSRPRGPCQASPAPAQGSYPAPAALVCICIDPVYDFMSPDGAFAAGLGVDDTEPVRAVGSRLSDVILSCKQYGYAGRVLGAWVSALLSRCATTSAEPKSCSCGRLTKRASSLSRAYALGPPAGRCASLMSQTWVHPLPRHRDRFAT